ncbi:hypothetical protein C943_03424 [Mariniradius saccharolyticus AK6]|uniref:Uncharacterized protein n=1 Tax=Mariniradius saccharolyticus AK6 TaxID=1239962 RepID=M7Y1X0_9BACT|nr:hypothetical protein C943_03424 [Mariniradius saccharolyticus AK6]
MGLDTGKWFGSNFRNFCDNLLQKKKDASRLLSWFVNFTPCRFID